MNNLLWLWVGLGGFLGSILRWYIAVNLPSLTGITFPLATFLVNGVGSFLLGVGIGISHTYTDSRYLAFGLTGFCGSFTTFSTFSAENLKMIQSDNFGGFLLYSTISVGVGLLAAGLGFWIGRAMLRS